MPTVDGLRVWSLARGPAGGAPFDSAAVLAAARTSREWLLDHWTLSTATRDALGVTVCTVFGPNARSTPWVEAVLQVRVRIDDSYPFGLVSSTSA